MKKNIITLIISAVLVLALIGGGVLAAHSINSGDTILINVSVGDIKLSGLTREEAYELLSQKGWVDRTETPLKVTSIGGVQVEVDPVRTGLCISAQDAVERAFAYGHDGDALNSLFAFISAIFKPVDVNAMNISVDNAYINGCIDTVLANIELHMGESEYVIDREAGIMRLNKGWGQIELDANGLKQAIVGAIQLGHSELEYTNLLSEPTAPDFDAILASVKAEPMNASYTDDGKFNVIDEVVGCNFDAEAAKTIWAKGAHGEELEIPVSITWPDVTGDELRSVLYRDLLGATTTKFTNSGDARRNNLRTATEKLNGFILYPGETFSFNGTVGERTEEAGFLPAPAYVGAKADDEESVKDEIGGGVCQISSTLYASTAFAFLETVERECHIFPVNYMQMGTDATVTIPNGGRSIDFKFKNNKSYPIKIVGIFDNEASTLTFEIWGTLEEDDYMPVKFDNSYGWQFDYMRELEPSYEGRAGYTIKLTHETYTFEDDTGPGYRTLTHREVYDESGKKVADDIINTKLANGDFAMDTYYEH